MRISVSCVIRILFRRSAMRWPKLLPRFCAGERAAFLPIALAVRAKDVLTHRAVKRRERPRSNRFSSVSLRLRLVTRVAFPAIVHFLDTRTSVFPHFHAVRRGTGLAFSEGR